MTSPSLNHSNMGAGNAEMGQISFTSDPIRTIRFISFFSAIGGPEKITNLRIILIVIPKINNYIIPFFNRPLWDNIKVITISKACSMYDLMGLAIIDNTYGCFYHP